MLKKKEYYRLDNVLENNAKYNLIFGGRNIGKTYAVKERFINRFFENPDTNQFAYIRRWEQDLKRKFLDCYFDDKGMAKIINDFSIFPFKRSNFVSDIYFYFPTLSCL